jgi:hypothetical protein
MRRIRKNLSYANVTATLALFLALGGGAYAAIDLVGRNDIKSKHIARNAVRGVDAREATFRGINAEFVNRKPVFTSDLVTLSEPASTSDPPAERVLFRNGPFTILARCTNVDPSSTRAQIIGSSTEPVRMIQNDTPFIDPNPPYGLSLAIAQDPGAPADNNDFLIHTPSSRTLQGLAAAQADAPTGTCQSRTSFFGG